MEEQAAGVHVLVTGASGMLGRRFTRSLVRRGRIGELPIARLTLTDLQAPRPPEAVAARMVESVAMDVTDGAALASVIAQRPDVVVHLAGIPSGTAEIDRERGYAVNLDGTRRLLDALAGVGGGYRPRVVFASSTAVFGPPLPPWIPDDQATAPATSYGTQKAIGELLVDDHTRRGHLDGVSLRLPTLCIRPDGPNEAVSGFFSDILREPLVGRPAVLPVGDEVRHWFASPRCAVGFLEHAATMDTARLGHRRALNLPGVSATVADQIEALRRVAGDGAVALIRREPDARVQQVVAGWPRAFDPARALALGFVAETSFDQIVTAHVEDALGGRLDAWHV